MFDVSFGEILIIAVVALIVIGPEKLPKVARTLGLLAGRMQRYVATVKDDIERELKADELRKLQQDVKQAVVTAESEIAGEMRQAEKATTTVIDEIAHTDQNQTKPGA